MFTFPFTLFTAYRIIEIDISASVNDYVLYDALVSGGYAPGSATPAGGRTIVKVTLANAVIIGSTSTTTAAFRTHDGDTYGSGWSEADAQIIAEGTDTATIQGKGGVGGDGSDVTAAAGGGGGGGGAGTQVGAGGAKGEATAQNGNAGTAAAGGTGGAAGTVATAGISAGTAGGAGGTALEASTGGPNITLRPASGATLRIWGGGGGGGGGYIAAGGSGGGPGLDGDADASASNAGGANGLAYSTPGSATITETGPGTIDDRGT